MTAAKWVAFIVYRQTVKSVSFQMTFESTTSWESLYVLYVGSYSLTN